MAARHRFGEKATPGLVNEKAKRALQNMSDEGRRIRRAGVRVGTVGDSVSVFDGSTPRDVD